jgi:hypothetical protein
MRFCESKGALLSPMLYLLWSFEAMRRREKGVSSAYAHYYQILLDGSCPLAADIINIWPSQEACWMKFHLQ